MQYITVTYCVNKNLSPNKKKLKKEGGDQSTIDFNIEQEERIAVTTHPTL